MTDYNLKRLSSYLDDELTQAQRCEFEQELAANKELQNELNIYKRFSNQLLLTHDHEASERIKAAVLSKRKQLIWRKRVAIFMPMAGAAIILAVISFSVLKPQKSITADDVFDQYSIALTELSK